MGCVSWWVQLLIAVVGGVLILWFALLIGLAVASRGRDRVSLREAARLGPDVVRLLRRLAADPTVPRGVRLRLGLLVGYLLLPIDLIPDFIPVIGYADDAIIVAIALRSVVRAAGAGVIRRRWPGTPAGLDVLHRLARLPPPEIEAAD